MLRSRFCGLVALRHVLFAMLALGAAAYLPAAHAAIVVAGAPPAINTPLQCKNETFTWGMVAGVAEAAASRCTSWKLDPRSPAGAAPGKPALAAGQKDLLFDFQHLVAGHPGEVAPNPVGGAATVDAGRYAAGTSRAGAFLIQHDPHTNVYIWAVSVPAGGPPASIQAQAYHTTSRFTPKWSYEPSVLGGPAIINSVTATYKTDPPKQVENTPTEKVSNKVGGTLPKGKTNEVATDVHIVVTLGDPYSSDMTLAFVVGEEGAFELAPLDIMNDAFLAGAEYFVPMVFDVDETLDLFIAVDLTQWLSFTPAFAEGDTFDFVGGANPFLPGYLVATMPFTFDPAVGFTSIALWDGTGIVFGTVDGGNVPEPAALGLLGLGLGALALYRRRRALPTRRD